MIGPPRGVEPARLFRLLLQTPRPTLPVRASFAGIVDGAFIARAITSVEFAGALDRHRDLPTDLRARRFGPELVALALCDEGGDRVFESARDVGELENAEAEALAGAVGDALALISPMHGVSDMAAWHTTLVRGAREQPHVAMALGGCVSSAGRRVSPRPDRYFGLPIGALTDGHWLAFWAANSVYEEASKR